MITVRELIKGFKINVIEPGKLISIVADKHYIGDLTQNYILEQFGEYNVLELDIDWCEDEQRILVTLRVESARNAIRIPLIRREDDAK